MAKKKMKGESFGHLETALAPMIDKVPIPKLSVRASMSHHYDDNPYRKDEVKRLQKEIEVIEKELKDWDGEKIASKALKSLKTELAVKRARKMEAEAHLDDDETSSELAG